MINAAGGIRTHKLGGVLGFKPNGLASAQPPLRHHRLT
jgi:hypothetical protein